MKDKELKKLLRSADCQETEIAVPDMSAKIKFLADTPVHSSQAGATVKVKDAKKSPVMKKKPSRLIAAILACSIFTVSCGTGLFFGLRFNYNFKKGFLASARAANAQYLPDAEKLASSFSLSSTKVQTNNMKTTVQSDYQTENSTLVEVVDLGEKEFNEIIEALAFIDGTGVFIPEIYDIYEIKAENEFVLKSAPIFGRWFRLDWMDETHGYIENFRYQYWAYNLKSDNDGKEITVTRVCSRPITYYELLTDKEFDVKQWQMMQTKFYYDEDGREVVECYVLTLVTDLKDRENGSWDDFNILNKINYIPVSIQYLRNVKDTSLTKYFIKFEESYLAGSGTRIDLRGLKPDGSTFDFVQLDYGGESDISMLRITGELPVDSIRTKPQATAISFYNKTKNDLQFYASVHDYYDEASSTHTFYPMPGRPEGEDIDIIELFSTAWPLITDTIDDNNSPIRRFGEQYYDGIAYSGDISRIVEHYDPGNKTKNDLMDSVFGAIGSLARKLGTDGKVNDYAQIDGFLRGMRKTAVKNFDIKSWIRRGKRAAFANEAKEPRGEFYGMDLPISNIFTSGMTWSPADIDDPLSPNDPYGVGVLGINGFCNVISEEILADPSSYSLEGALISEEGHCVLVSKNSSRFGSGKYNFFAYFNFSDLKIDIPGIYTLTYILVKKNEGSEDTVLLNTKAPITFFINTAFEVIKVPSGYQKLLRARSLKIIVP